MAERKDIASKLKDESVIKIEPGSTVEQAMDKLNSKKDTIKKLTEKLVTIIEKEKRDLAKKHKVEHLLKADTTADNQLKIEQTQKMAAAQAAQKSADETKKEAEIAAKRKDAAGENVNN